MRGKTSTNPITSLHMGALVHTLGSARATQGEHGTHRTESKNCDDRITLSVVKWWFYQSNHNQ